MDWDAVYSRLSTSEEKTSWRQIQSAFEVMTPQEKQDFAEEVEASIDLLRKRAESTDIAASETATQQNTTSSDTEKLESTTSTVVDTSATDVEATDSSITQQLFAAIHDMTFAQKEELLESITSASKAIEEDGASSKTDIGATEKDETSSDTIIEAPKRPTTQKENILIILFYAILLTIFISLKIEYPEEMRQLHKHPYNPCNWPPFSWFSRLHGQEYYDREDDGVVRPVFHQWPPLP